MQSILVVEDESVIRNALRRLLERNGYAVSEAGSVQEAENRFPMGLEHATKRLAVVAREPGATPFTT